MISNVALPRVKSSSESDKAKLEGCIQGCELSHAESIKNCDKGLHNHPRPEDYMICQIQADITRDKCFSACEKIYGKK